MTLTLPDPVITLEELEIKEPGLLLGKVEFLQEKRDPKVLI